MGKRRLHLFKIRTTKQVHLHGDDLLKLKSEQLDPMNFPMLLNDHINPVNKTHVGASSDALLIT